MNFCELNMDSKRPVVRIPRENSKHLRQILQQDSQFLMSQGIMDYSLLLVTEILPESQRSNGSVRKYKMKYDRNSVQSVDGKEACHFGIIDYLQEWNFNKKVEALYKHHLKHKNKHKISAVPPEPYQKRFCQFIEDNILVSKKKQKVKKAQELSKV